MKVVVVSVVRDRVMYERCIAGNQHLADVERVALDNREKNEPIPVLYNHFLDGYDYAEPVWFVFCHEDFQMLEPLGTLLAKADAGALWGPVGATTTWRWGVNPRLTVLGGLQESDKTGGNLRTLGNVVSVGTMADTLDCMCVAVHSSLVQAHHLRFDERFDFDLYAEDFCVTARQVGAISRILPLQCRHWSKGELGARYQAAEQTFSEKWPNVCVTGTSSEILGGGAGVFRRLLVGLKRAKRRFAASQSLKGMGWSFAGKFSVKAVQFGFSIILARLLCPADFGLVGMIAIFLAFCEIFADCGFGAALIRKQNRTEDDYATVFWFKAAIAALGYWVLFFAAPLIARFYHEPLLVPITRVVALGLVISCMASVAYLRLWVALKFRTMALLAFLGSLLSGVVGVLLAWRGLGVWAVVGQGLSWHIINCCLLFAATRWLPAFRFSRASFRSFFDFGWKHLMTGVINATYQNGYAMVVGRAFGAADLGLFNRADYYTAEAGNVVSGVVNDVNYPILSSYQNDPDRLWRSYRRLQWLVAGVMLPGMALLAVFAEPLIRFIIGEQWVPCVPYLQVLAIGAAVNPLVSLTVVPMCVKGRTDLALKLELIEKPLAFGLLLAAIPFGILAICVAKSISLVLFLLVNSVVLGKVLWKR